MAKQPRFGIVAMCDAAYQDIYTGKSVLAGVFSGPVIVQAFPTAVPVSFYIEIFFDDSEPHQVDLQIFVDEKHFGGAKAEMLAENPKLPLVLITPPRDVAVEGPCTIELRVVADGGKSLVAISRAVNLVETTASPPASSRSPTASPASGPQP